MSASGLIYAAIALMWAAVLIPMWLRNHDTASENRSAERFGQAMRVLSGRERAADGASLDEEEHWVPTESTAASTAESHTASTTASATASTTAPAPVHRAAPKRRAPQPRAHRRPARRTRTLAQRRTRTLGVLASLVLVLAVLAPLTAVPWWAPLPLLALLVAFVVHLRVQVLQRQRRRPRADQRAERPASRRVDGRVDQRHRSDDRAAVARDEVDANQSGVPDASAAGFVPGPSRAVTVETKRRAASAEADVPAPQRGDQAWDPNPLPLPTYVTAPKAVRPIKVIDLTTPGAWTSGRLLDDGLADEDLLAAEVATDELDALLEHEAAPPAQTADGAGESGRRAVGD